MHPVQNELVDLGTLSLSIRVRIGVRFIIIMVLLFCIYDTTFLSR